MQSKVNRPREAPVDQLYFFERPVDLFFCGVSDMADEVRKFCPHCDQEMLKWSNPDGTTWGEGYQLVCFNDECTYFVSGWKHMKDNYNQNVSYRYRLNPETGEKGPLPVWSVNALKDQIIE